MSADRATSLPGSRWTCALVSLLGAFEVLMAMGAGSALIRVVGIVGGLALAALAAAAAQAGHRRATRELDRVAAVWR
jgi:hypothetical protein